MNCLFIDTTQKISTSPLLTAKKHSKQMEEVISSLSIDCGIEKKYNSLIGHVSKSMVNKDIGDIRSFLLTIPAFIDDHQIMLLHDARDKIESFRTVDGLITFLFENFSSFLDCSIVKTLVDGMRSEENRDKIENYLRSVEIYLAEHTLRTSLPRTALIKPNTGMKKICIKWEVECTLNTSLSEVCKLRNDVAERLRLRSYCLYLHDIDIIHTEVTFLIPVAVADVVLARDNMAERADAFQALSVRWLECGEVFFNFNKVSI